MTPEGKVRIQINWSKQFGSDVDQLNLQLFRVSEEFMMEFYSVPLRAWTFSNYPFENIVFLKGKNDLHEMVFVEGECNSFTILTSGEIPLELSSVEDVLESYFVKYDDIAAELYS